MTTSETGQALRRGQARLWNRVAVGLRIHHPVAA
jgi:hypothetical protein